MVKTSYSRVGYGLLAVVLAAMYILCIWVFVDGIRLQLIYGGTDLGIFLSPLCVGILALGCGSGMSLSWINTWRSSLAYNRRRQAAARGEGVTLLLDGELRTNSREPLTFPATIRLRMSWHSRDVGCVLGGVFALLQFANLIALIPFFTNRDSYGWPLPLIVLATEGGLLALLGGIGILMIASSREVIRVTGEGISVRRIGGWRLVRWDEARLFALISGNHYELASAHAIVRWWRTSRHHSAQPTVPYDEYQRRMDGLLLLVRERTGLPLYAVMKER